MDVLSIKPASLPKYILLTAVALAVAWCFQAQVDSPWSPLTAAGLLAAAAALASPDHRRAHRAGLAGLAAGVGFLLGSGVDYAHHYSALLAPGDWWHAFFKTTVKAGIWAGLGGACLGMAQGSVRYRAWDLLWLIPVLALAVLFAPTFFLRGEIHGVSKELGLALMLLAAWLAVVKRDRPAVLLTGCATAGAMIGALAGFGLHIASKGQVPLLAAEAITGAGIGTGCGLALFTLDEGLERPASYASPLVNRFALITFAWGLPFAVLLTAGSSRPSPWLAIGGVLALGAVLMALSIREYAAEQETTSRE